MIKKILIAIAVVIGGLCTYAALQDPNYHFYRELTMNAPAEKVFPFINAAKEMDRWMPWQELDTQVKMTHSGPESGVGSKASWESPGQMGVGSSTLVESVPNQSTKFALSYQKPYAMEQTAYVTIRSEGAGSVVRWGVEGKNNFLMRLMCLFMSMDKMMGPHFDKGLGKLKGLVETP